MKKLLFIALIALCGRLNAQDSLLVSTEKKVIRDSVHIGNSNVTRTIPFQVGADTRSLKYVIKVFADVGLITVRLRDPTGKKMFNVTLGTMEHENKHEPSKGELFDELVPKVYGEWEFEILAVAGMGYVKYQFEIANK
jgi:hypothetical protein